MTLWKSFTIKGAIFTVANAVKETTFKKDFYRIMTLEEHKRTVGSDNNKTNCISA